MPIPAFKISFDSDFRKQFGEFCDQILDEGFLTDHTFVRRFETEFSEFSGVPHAIAVNSGTAALEAVLVALGVAGKEVILPANTFIATAAAVESAGGIPVAVDIERDAFGIDPAALEKRISSRTAAVIVVHVGGLISPRIQEISALCSSRGIPLIEDCAHAHGCSFEGTQAGAFGVAGCFSFFPTKVMTAGEGGMIVTRDISFAENLRSIRRFGHEAENSISHARRGSNFKMTEFQAALGLLDLRRAPARLLRRAALARRYQKNLNGSAWRAIAAAEKSVCTHYKQIVVAPVPRVRIEETLARRDISLSGGVYYIPLHRQPYYRKRFEREQFPVADWFSESHICPPCYPELTDDEVDQISDVLLGIQN